MFSVAKLQKYILSPIIPIIRINGIIDTVVANEVSNSLKNINPNISKALGVVISSPGGSPTQADIIIQKLKIFCHHYNLPLYTFGEEVCTGVGYYILSAGKTVYVDQSTQIGSLTEFPKFVGMINIKNKKQISEEQQQQPEKEQYQFSNKKDKWYLKQIDLTEEISEPEEKILQKIEQQIHDSVLEQIIVNRHEKLKDAQTLKGQIQVAKKIQKSAGIFDEFGNFQQVLNSLYPKAQIVLVSQRPLKIKVQQYVKKAIDVIKSVRNKKKIAKESEEQIKQ